MKIKRRKTLNRERYSMAKITKNIVDSKLRDEVFADIIHGYPTDNKYEKINDRQYGTILVDANGKERYVRIGVIVAELREDMSARELMAKEIAEYQSKRDAKAEKELAKAKKAEADKKRRAEKEKESK